jgi:hypothetical protein
VTKEGSTKKSITTIVDIAFSLIIVLLKHLGYTNQKAKLPNVIIIGKIA